MPIQSYDIARRHGSGISRFIEGKGIRFVQSFEKKVQLHPNAKQGIQACCENSAFTVALVNDSSYMITQNSLAKEIERFCSSNGQAPDKLCIIQQTNCFIYDLSVIE